MGVIDDSDVDKIVEAYKKTRIDKTFFNPKKAQTNFYIVLIVAIVSAYSAILFGYGMFAISEEIKTNTQDAKEFESLILQHTDCDSLKSIYNELRIDHFGWDENTLIIKDEISFRC